MTASPSLNRTPRVRGTMLRWMLQFFPGRDPADRPIAPMDQERMVAELVRDLRDTYRACPSLHVEDALSDCRTGNERRKPEKQDAIDLMMAVPALAYCDAFVSYDGYVAEGAVAAATAKASTCFVARLPSQVAAQFAI